MKRVAYVLIALLFLAGCSDSAETKAALAKRIDARIGLFKECMILASRLQRQANDDVAEVVENCSNQAYYMTNQIQ